jgi:hypothetical protein
MQLNCLERIVTLQLLANYKEGSFLTFKTLAELRSKLGFTEEEITNFELKETDGNYTWNLKGSETTKIEISESEQKLIKTQLEILDKEEKLTPIHLSLYEKAFETNNN